MDKYLGEFPLYMEKKKIFLARISFQAFDKIYMPNVKTISCKVNIEIEKKKSFYILDIQYVNEITFVYRLFRVIQNITLVKKLKRQT